jgi:hypothetical protein
MKRGSSRIDTLIIPVMQVLDKFNLCGVGGQHVRCFDLRFELEQGAGGFFPAPGGRRWAVASA